MAPNIPTTKWHAWLLVEFHGNHMRRVLFWAYSLCKWLKCYTNNFPSIMIQCLLLNLSFMRTLFWYSYHETLVTHSPSLSDFETSEATNRTTHGFVFLHIYIHWKSNHQQETITWDGNCQAHISFTWFHL